MVVELAVETEEEFAVDTVDELAGKSVEELAGDTVDEPVVEPAAEPAAIKLPAWASRLPVIPFNRFLCFISSSQ